MRFVAVSVVALAISSTGYAQDPIKVDPKHYKVEFENDQVRVLRIGYAPGERSVTHQHPNAVAVMLTDNDFQMTLPDGKAERTQGKRGSVLWTPAGTHVPQNMGKSSAEVLLIELKR